MSRASKKAFVQQPVKLAYKNQIQKLLQNGLINANVRLQMPAYDVDYNGGGGSVNPERDQVYFNGHLVPGSYLTGDNNIWVMNTFDVPVEWVNFADDPGDGSTASPADNIIEIHIDTANTSESWCTAIDWVVLDIGPIPRPNIFVHGIFSSGAAWDKGGAGEASFVGKCEELGLVADNGLNMGNLDSISDNSRKVRDRVDRVLRRYGVNKVNLVCHSKGGLDSREYAELLAGEKLDQLIQLGTPNAGSPLADAVQAGLFRGGGLIGGVLINGLVSFFQGPAGLQLTTPYMGLYNRFHGHNPEVSYYAVAGDYRPGSGFFDDLLEKALLAVVGPGDTIVPLDSVYALSYVSALPSIVSVGPNKEATHTSMNGSPGFFSRILPYVQKRSQVRAASIGEALLEGGVTLFSTGAVFESTSPVNISVIVDQPLPTLFTVMYPTGQVLIALISPSGTRFAATNTVGNTNITFQDSALFEGPVSIAGVLVPEIGTWQVEIVQTNPTTIDGTNGYLLLVTSSGNELKLEPSATPISVSLNKEVLIEARLGTTTQTVTGAVVVAAVTTPQTNRLELTLRDDGTQGDRTSGDGVYSISFGQTTETGLYTVAMLARKSPDGSDPGLMREGLTLFTVGREQIGLAGQFSDSGEDTDANGLFNWLRVSCGLAVTNPGTFIITGELADSVGNNHVASTRVVLDVGLTNAFLRFFGNNLFSNRVNGPYMLKHLTIASEEGISIATQLTATNLFSTAAYNYTQFEGARLAFGNLINSQGVDTDADGLFDKLAVTLSIESSVAGSFSASLRLVDTNASLITIASRTVALASGTNEVTFEFDGSAIGQHGVDSPYPGKDLLLFDGSGNSLTVADVFILTGYTASQFEGFTGPMLRIASASAATLNRQTGLYEQFVTVTNESSASIEAARISINGLPSVVTSYNASGTNGSGIPHIQLNQALAPGSSITVRLEYYSADRVTVPQPTLLVEASSIVVVPQLSGTSMAILKTTLRPDGSMAVEFRTTPRKTYIVEYSTDMTNWKQSIPAVPAFGERLIWIDDGPPKTESRPGSGGARFYRVLELP